MKTLKEIRKRNKNSSLVITIRQFWQGQRWQLWMMSFVFALLLLFLHVFVLASRLTAHTAQGVKEKLGIYFYIKDPAQIGSGVTQEQVSARIMKFKDTLTAGGIKVVYYSKDDAFKNLQRRLPNMVKSFDQYGIENPLPITLYAIFANQEQYDYVMQTKEAYADMLLANTMKTVMIDSQTGSVQTDDSTLQDQFVRNARIINVLHVLQFFFSFIIAACVLVIVVFLSLIIKTKFTAMHHTIHVQKLLGSSFLRLKKPFFYNSFLMLLCGYCITVVLSLILLSNLASVFPYLFGMSIAEVFGGIAGLKLFWLFIEFLVLLVISLGYANFQLGRLLRKEV